MHIISERHARKIIQKLRFHPKVGKWEQVGSKLYIYTLKAKMTKFVIV